MKNNENDIKKLIFMITASKTKNKYEISREEQVSIIWITLRRSLLTNSMFKQRKYC